MNNQAELKDDLRSKIKLVISLLKSEIHWKVTSELCLLQDCINNSSIETIVSCIDHDELIQLTNFFGKGKTGNEILLITIFGNLFQKISQSYSHPELIQFYKSMESLGLLTKFEQTALLVEDESVKLEIYIASMLALGCQKINKTPYIEKVLKVFLEKLKQFSQQSSFNEIDRLLNGILKALVLLSRTTGNAKLFPMISKQDIGSKKHPLHCFLFSDDIKSMKNAGFIIVQCSTALYAERLALTHLLSSNTDFSELYKKRTEEAEESNNSPMHEQKLSRLSVLNELIVQFLFVCELDDSLSSLLTEGLMKEQLCNIVINAALNKNTEDVNLKARDLIRSISTQISSSLSTWKKFDSLRQMAKRKLDSGYEPKSSLDKDQKGKDEVNEESDLESEDEFLEFFTLLDSPPELESEEETTSEDDEYEDEGN